MLETIFVISTFCWIVFGLLYAFAQTINIDNTPMSAVFILGIYYLLVFPFHFVRGLYRGSKFWINFFLEERREKKRQELQEKDAALRLLDKEAKLSLKEGVHR